MEHPATTDQKEYTYPIFSLSALKRAVRITFFVLLFNFCLNILDFLFLSHKQSLEPFFDLSLISSGLLMVIGSTIAFFESIEKENDEESDRPKRIELKFFPTYDDNPYAKLRTVSKEEAIFQGKLMLLSGFITFLFIVTVDLIAKAGGLYYVVVLNTLIFGFSGKDLHWFSTELKSVDIHYD
ncbi:MAG: hypothetical protein ACW967_03490 [Candidatus Hodarchaeales archaeon]